MAAARSIRVVLVNDLAMIRDALAALLQKAGISVVGEASTGEQAIALAADLHPDVIILKLGIPDLNSIEAAKAILHSCKDTKVLILSAYAADASVLEALRAGVMGYVLKSESGAGLVEAIQEVHSGNLYVTPRISRVLVEAYLKKTSAPADTLTPRERQVLKLVAEGKSTRQVAAQLGLKAKTAESHRLHLMTKLGIHNTAELVRYAIRRGILQP